MYQQVIKIFLFFKLILCIGVNTTWANDECIMGNAEKEFPPIKSIALNREVNKKDFYKLIVLTDKNKKFENEYYCMKKDKGFYCVGDDDSGKFWVKNNMLILEFLNMGHPDQDMFHLSPDFAVKHKIQYTLKKGKCF